MTELINRIQWAKDNLAPVQCDLRVVFEVDPLDGHVSVLAPAPEWMAMALHGGLLPPVEVYHQLETDANGRITNGHILHKSKIPAMTEEEAIEYLIQMCIPPHVWRDTSGNARRMVICRKDQLPKTRSFRNAWKINQTVPILDNYNVSSIKEIAA